MFSDVSINNNSERFLVLDDGSDKSMVTRLYRTRFGIAKTAISVFVQFLFFRI